MRKPALERHGLPGPKNASGLRAFVADAVLDATQGVAANRAATAYAPPGTARQSGD